MVDWPDVFPNGIHSAKKEKNTSPRQMEVNAAFLEHVDYHVGRVMSTFEEMGELDNTLMYILLPIMVVRQKEHLPEPFPSC
jgi:membrane-anchored protein YejM (alkaline phosphatase superfamily)